MIRHFSDDDFAVACHEAGHAVAAIEVGIFVRYATLEATPDALGHVAHSSLGTEEDTSIMLFLLAGAAAEQKALGRPHRFGEGDLRHARTMMRLTARTLKCRGATFFDSDEQRLQRWFEKATGLVERNWQWITRVARHLLIYRTLAQGQIIQLRSMDSLQ